MSKPADQRDQRAARPKKAAQPRDNHTPARLINCTTSKGDSIAGAEFPTPRSPR
ncbi:hypothetical protein SZN_29560 [Streptomyces zinciresistens K42]|uniref:Uncharacterized protein n=1 Tax=Streptomyces zinciresistens K42 TaxID=700597 RepID=G2GK69_9ACTN|nr:hypothetical protein [Streptomyces zinciresistens]EGX56090.1 hypothetical protein SZN_29560 [Streptomyces zinciresistens K42]